MTLKVVNRRNSKLMNWVDRSIFNHNFAPEPFSPSDLLPTGVVGHWSGGFAPAVEAPASLFRDGSLSGIWGDINGGL